MRLPSMRPAARAPRTRSPRHAGAAAAHPARMQAARQPRLVARGAVERYARHCRRRMLDTSTVSRHPRGWNRVTCSRRRPPRLRQRQSADRRHPHRPRPPRHRPPRHRPPRPVGCPVGSRTNESTRRCSRHPSLKMSTVGCSRRRSHGLPPLAARLCLVPCKTSRPCTCIACLQHTCAREHSVTRRPNGPNPKRTELVRVKAT